MLLSQAVDEFMTLHVKHLARETREAYEWQLDRWLSWCADAGVHDTDSLRALHLAKYLDALRTRPGRPLASRSLRNYAKKLRCLCRWLVDEELATSRLLKWEVPKAERSIPAALTGDQITALIRACQASHGHVMQARDTALVLLMLDTGLRVTEACSLRLSDVRLDTSDAYVLVRFGKGARWREAGPLGKRTVRALRTYIYTWRPKQDPQTDHLFINRSDGDPMDRRTVQALMTRLARRAGLDELHPHMLRHSWTRARAMAGTPTATIQKLLGHASLETTSIYLSSFNSTDARRQVSSLVDGL